MILQTSIGSRRVGNVTRVLGLFVLQRLKASARLARKSGPMVELAGRDTPARGGLDVLIGPSSVAVDVVGRSLEFLFGYVFF